MESLISVIVPIFNAENHLDECIQSIKNQTYNNLEILLVNDGSTDNSLEICYQYALKDNRIKVINKPNGGVSTARNWGLDASNGNFIGFVDSDDTIRFNMYEELINSISEEDDAAILILNSMKNSELKTNKVTCISGEEGLKRILKLQLPTSQWAYLYRSSTLGDLRNEEDIHFFEDFLFNVKFILQARNLRLYKKDLYNYRVNIKSINHQQINSKKLSCLKIYERLSPNLNMDNKLIKNDAQYFRSHFLISMILSLSKTNNLNKEKMKSYMKKLHESAVDMVRDISSSNQVPFIYKLIIFLLSKSPTKVISLIRFLKYKKINSIK